MDLVSISCARASRILLMLIREIPGYYYDEEKGRYFKVVNGSTLVNKTYHNSRVQAEERRKGLQKSHPGKGHDQRLIHNGNTGNGIDNDEPKLVHWRLGHFHPLPNDLTFERLRHIKEKSCTAHRQPYLRTWGTVSFNGEPEVLVSSLYDVLLLDKGFNDFSRLMFWRHFERIKTNLAPINMPEVCDMSCDGRYLCYNINVSSIDFPSRVQNYIRFERFDVADSVTKCDFTDALYSYCHSMAQSSFRHFLGLILGMNAISLHPDGYKYVDDRLFVDSVSISSVLVHRGKVYLGCTNSWLLVLSFNEVDGGVKFVDSCMVSTKSKGPITKIQVLLDDRITFSTDKTLTVLDSSHRQMHRINHGDKIKNFEVQIFPHLIVAHIIGLTKIRTYRILPNGERTITQIQYYNDNIAAQVSFIEDNVLVVNESESKLRVTNLVSLKSSVVQLDNFEPLRAIFKRGKNLVIHCCGYAESKLRMYN